MIQVRRVLSDRIACISRYLAKLYKLYMKTQLNWIPLNMIYVLIQEYEYFSIFFTRIHKRIQLFHSQTKFFEQNHW